MKRFLPVLVFLLLLSSISLADEGMWMLDGLKKMDWKTLKEKGIELNAKDIYNPKGSDISDAVVQLGGGTGTFVSPKGLILTNHHVAYGAIQRQSSAEQDFINNGFLAKTTRDEIPAKGYQARLCVEMKDVTKKILKGVSQDMSYGERYEILEKNKRELREAAETEDFIQASVQEMLSGTQYYLFKYFVIKDIRLVYAPPRSVGEYGGDIDNWMWPRHTGDFSFMRAYVDRNGKPAEFSEDNIPYKPEKYLKISINGIKENDFTMVIGYPGNTMRYRTSYSINLWEHSSYPRTIDFCKTNITALEELAGEDRDLQIKYASRIKGLNNVLKNNQGMVEGLKKSRLLERKRNQEKKFKAFLKKKSKLQKKYGNVLPEIEKIYADLNTYHEKQNFLGYVMGSSQLLGNANYIYRWSIERKKKQADREPGFSDKNVSRVKKNIIQQKDLIDIPADKKLLAIWIEKAGDLPEGQKIEAVEKIIQGKTGKERKMLAQAFVEEVFSKTIFTDFDASLDLFKNSKEEIDRMNDPLIKFAAELQKESEQIQDKYDIFVGAVYKLRPPLIRGMYEWKKSSLYPDANGTIRFTYGFVKGYSPRDAVKYGWVTTLKGVVDKNTGEEPFDNPDELTRLYQEKDFGKYADKNLNDVPVNFLHDTDITGGNSGSSVLNGKGEIIGLVFDGNYESMTSDFQFDPALTRTISVDSRYIIFITEKLGKADNVLKELEIVQ
ncbi:hypothetical protein B6I21_00640 [candidate division KSB1 bacterium 4572_119]|nr:MAG: hypothetical protein B6I21_00640 [candidate division KSB1 bacterium 4572_119]